jgi:hypothetical protein
LRQTGIHLNSNDPRTLRNQVLGQRSSPRADFDHQIFGPDASGLDDASGHVGLCQEMLPKPPS